MFRVSKDATWTVRALSGGYARMPDKKEIKEGGYKVIGEALETFAAILAMGLEDDKDLVYATTRDGRRFLSSMPVRDADVKPRTTKGSFGI